MVIKGVLSEGEVGRLNDAIDRHSHLITRPPDSYSHGSPAMRGESNLITKLARQLLALEEAGAGEDELAAAGQSMVDAYSAAADAELEQLNKAFTITIKPAHFFLGNNVVVHEVGAP